MTEAWQTHDWLEDMGDTLQAREHTGWYNARRNRKPRKQSREIEGWLARLDAARERMRGAYIGAEGITTPAEAKAALKAARADRDVAQDALRALGARQRKADDF